MTRSGPSILPAAEHPGRCGACGDVIVLRGGVAGYVGAEARCASCLRREAPALGWALELVAEADATLHGKWPRKPDGEELEPILTLLRAVRAAFERRRGRRQQAAAALRLMADHLQETRMLLLESARHLAAAYREIRGPAREGVQTTESLMPPPESS